MPAPICSYVPATSVIDPTRPGGIDAMLAFHRATFGTAVMENDDDDTADDDADDEAPQVNEHGFPDKTPWKQMTPEHQAAYWRHQSRKHEDRANGFKDYEQVKAERDELKSKHQSADEKAAEKALADAKAAGNAEALAALAPRLVAAEFKSAGAGKIPGAQLDALISGVHAPNFLTPDGEVDTDKVEQYLTPFLASDDGQGGGSKKKWPDMGQGRRQSSKTAGVGAGADLYAARHSKKKS